MASVVYNSFKRDMMNGLRLDIDTIQCILVSDSYIVDIDNHSTYSDVLSAEVTPNNGYATSGVTMTGKTFTVDNVLDRSIFIADPVKWSNTSFTARGAVMFKRDDTPSTSPLVAYVDFGRNRSSSSGNFEIHWSTSDGILNVK